MTASRITQLRNLLMPNSFEKAAALRSQLRAYPRTTLEVSSLGPAAAGGRKILNHQAVLRRALKVVLNRLRKPLSATTGTIPHHGSNDIRVRIAKLDQQGKPGPAHAVRLKEFDQRGIVFHHRQPFCDRRARVTLEGPDFGPVVAEVDLRWCRFTRTGQYTSGGRFVKLVRKSA